MSDKAKNESQSHEGVQPQLRFPEFKNAPAWEVKPLGDVADVLQGYGFPEKHQGKTQGKFPFYKVSDISNSLLKGEHLIKDSANYIDDGTLKALKAKLIPVGATIFAKIGEAIRSNRRAITSIPCLIDNNVAALKRKQLWTIDRFVYYTFSLIKLENHAGGAVPSVNKSTIESIAIACPGIAEQQRIADCLASLDDLIDANAQKLTALKQHKKGLMQELFPATGQTLPKRRFAEFKNAPEWEVKPLGNILKITSTKRVHESEWQDAGVPFYRARELVSLSKNEMIAPLFISEELYAKNIKLSGQISKDDLLITGVGSIGFPYLVKESDRFYFKDGNIIWLKNDGKELLGQYLFLLYQTDYVQSQIRTMAGVGTVGTYTIDNANNTKVPFPKCHKEQQRIADCLASLDDLITAQDQKIHALKRHKTGLMQQLFPAIAEVQI